MIDRSINIKINHRHAGISDNCVVDARADPKVPRGFDLFWVLPHCIPCRLQLTRLYCCGFGFPEPVEPETEQYQNDPTEGDRKLTQSPAGFHVRQPTPGSVLDLFAKLRRERIIPA